MTTVYTSISISNRQNSGTSKLTNGTRCEHCGKPIAMGQRYTVHAVQTSPMPASTFCYYHTDHAPKQGSGWGSFHRGEAITPTTQVDEGDLLLHYSHRFNSYNLVRVATGEEADEPSEFTGRKFHGVFVNPEDPGKLRRHTDEAFSVWMDDLGEECFMYRPLAA